MSRRDDWVRLGAAELARRLSRRELSAVELMRSCLRRIDAREHEVRAFVHLDADAALAAARRLDAGPILGPLHGLPIGIKDLFDTHDMPTGYGSPIHAGRRPAGDAAAVARCRQAGAIAIGKTVTTEFATFQPGPTRNPNALACTPGGSSSGSAAAVADAMVPLALGTQTAASIVRPAAYCGVTGFKPSFGIVPRAGVKSLADSLDTIGGFGLRVADVALLVSVLAADPRLAEVESDLRPRIGFFRGPHWDRVSADLNDLWEAVTFRLARDFPGSREIAVPPGFGALSALHADIMASQAAGALADEYARHPAQLSPMLRSMLDAGRAVEPGALQSGRARVRALAARAARLFDEVDVLLTPSADGEAGAADAGTGDPLFGRAWTLLGLPCLHLPLGAGTRGLPIGLQLVGPQDADSIVLRAGHRVESVPDR